MEMKASILLVEDEEKLARFVELELMHEGYKRVIKYGIALCRKSCMVKIG